MLLICCLGICLPRNILDLFPEQNQSGSHVSRYLHELEVLESNMSGSSLLMKNQFLNEFDVVVGSSGGVGGVSSSGTVGGVPDESAMSSMSDISSNSKRIRKWPAMPIEATKAESINSSTAAVSKHNRNGCLLCSRQKVVNRITEASSTMNTQETTTSSSRDHSITNGKTKSNQALSQQDVSFYSPESILSDDSNMPDQIASKILKYIQKMANPIVYKASKNMLLELKQKYPQSFQDICLYSEVAKCMGKCTFRLNSRRFIQEIFLDLNYDAFYNDLDIILSVIQQRLADYKLLDNSTTLLQSHSMPSTSTSTSSLSSSSPVVASSTPSTITTTISSTAGSQNTSHKLHSIKSPLLASVYETSVENLIDPKLVIDSRDEIDAGHVTLRTSSFTEVNTKDNLLRSGDGGSSHQIEVEVHQQQQQQQHHRHSSITESLADMNVSSSMRRRRFNTLELDLSCTKNKFPIKHRTTKDYSPTTSATGTLGRGTTTSSTSSYTMQGMAGKEDDHSIASNLSSSNTSSYSFISNSVINLNSARKLNIEDDDGVGGHDVIGKAQTRSLSVIQTSSSAFASSSSSSTRPTTSATTATSPVSPPFGSLFCEQRLLKTSKSEATLNNNNNNINKNNNNSNNNNNDKTKKQ